MEKTKTFLLDLPKQSVDMLDAYCTSKSITRTEFFRQLVNSWLISNTSEVSEVVEEIHERLTKFMPEEFKGSLEKTSQMLRALVPIPNYLDHYRDTEMYKLMIANNDKVEKATTPLSENVMSYPERELMKALADTMSKYGFFDDGIMLKDISHWQRYLQSNPGEEKSFLEYVDRKYTNPDLRTY